MPEIFTAQHLKQLHLPTHGEKSTNGQLTIIAGSDLFHGPALLSLKIATRIADMVFFTSPHPEIEEFAHYIKSQIAAFIWIPFDEVDQYIAKSDATLIGPGLKRFRSEKQLPTNHLDLDEEGMLTKRITERLLQTFSQKQWIIDGGSLQTITPDILPPNAIITPNHKEFSSLFNQETHEDNQELKSKQVQELATKYTCIITAKGSPTIVASSHQSYAINGGNPGMTKGGIGDCLAALTAALACKNDPTLAAASADFIIKSTADHLFQTHGPYYSADDISENIAQTFTRLL